MGHPYQLNHNSDTQHGLTQVSSPVSNPASIRLMSAWLCYPLNRHIEVPPDKKAFWFIVARQDAMKEVMSCSFHQACDKLEFPITCIFYSRISFGDITRYIRS